MDVDVMAADRERVFTSRRQSVRIGMGPFRNYDLRLAVQWQGEITAYGVGEIDLVRNLLTTIGSLGRLRRNGWGKIAALRIDPAAPAEAQRWKQRTLPASFFDQALQEHQPAQGTCRPPYWDRSCWTDVLEWIP